MSESLFQSGDFTLHSGAKSPFLINCDALTDADLDALACVYSLSHRWYRVVGIPHGGLRFAAALARYSTPDVHQTLVADDVLTTGTSMREALDAEPNPRRGVAIFARGPVPPGIDVMLRTWEADRA